MGDAPKESLLRKKHPFFWEVPKFEGTLLPKLILTPSRAKIEVKKLRAGWWVLGCPTLHLFFEVSLVLNHSCHWVV